MNVDFIHATFTGKCLVSVTFKLEKKIKKSNIFQKQHFPVVVRPKEPSITENNHQFVNYTEESSTIPTSLVYSSVKDDVARPRNKFIIARSILSKPVKSTFQGSTDDISKIISIIWHSNSGTNFQHYFQYLSFLEDQWHESYYPLYHYHPKKKTQKHAVSTFQNSKGNMSSSVFIDEGQPLAIARKQISPSPAINSAKDIREISQYVDLCSSTYVRQFSTENGTKKITKAPSSYKDCTMKFSLDKVTKPTKNRTTRATNDNLIKLHLQTFKSPLYGDRGEDICFSSL